MILPWGKAAYQKIGLTEFCQYSSLSKTLGEFRLRAVLPRPLVPDPDNSGVGKRYQSMFTSRFCGFFIFQQGSGGYVLILLNGENVETKEDSSIAELLLQLGISRERIAVELNLDIVPRGKYDEQLLADGDKIEIVHFVGGG